MVSWGSSAGFLNDIKSANHRINQRINEQTNKHKAELNGVPKHTGSRRSFIDQWMHTHGKGSNRRTNYDQSQCEYKA